MAALPKQMNGIVLTGHGGPECLVWRTDLPMPQPGPGEVLIRVAASAVNNTDINTRIGWYSKSVRGDTAAAAAGDDAGAAAQDGGWSGTPLQFPRIQGADCCGTIVAIGGGVDPGRLGERVLVRAMQSIGGDDTPFACRTFGSEYDGAFAEYARTFAADALPVRSDWSDVELASIPCAYSTAEGMLQRAAVGAERVLVTGASGGVGSAAIQLAKRRGAHVTAVAGRGKGAALQALGADEILDRDAAIPADSFETVVDLVAGPAWPGLIDGLRRGGRYVASGAIAGPIVELDIRTLYLRDLTLLGSTWQPANVMQDVIGYIERNEIRPVIAETYALAQMAAAQAAFLAKRHVGKIGIQVAH